MTSPEEWLAEHPDYAEHLQRIVQYGDDEWDGWGETFIEDTDYEYAFSYKDVGIHPTALYQLETAGFLERVFDTNSTTAYALQEEDVAREAADIVSNDETGAMPEVKHEFPDEEELPDDLFEDVIGYDDVKWILRRALSTEDIVNVLLVGPPGSAKTVFLMAIQELEGSEFVSGKSSSGPGVLDVMFDQTPRYLAIDEFDDVDKDTQKVLSQHMDTGIVDETKYNKNRRLKTDTNTFGSANSMSKIIDQVQDRFIDLHFEEYTKAEFEEICEHMLPRKESVSPEEARVIAHEVWNIEDRANVRKAIAVARLSRGDPKKVIDVMGDYSESSLKSGFGV